MKYYPWLFHHFKKLITNYRSGNKHHALLIHTVPGMGEDKLIYAIIKFLICQNPGKYQSCNECTSCQLMQAQSHPDYYLIAPATDKDVIGIEEIRKISEKVHEHAHFIGNKVIWIKNAIKLTESSAHALLKILEEPLEKTYFFLSCYDLYKLLATIRSRCHIYYLNTPDERWVMNWLAKEVKSSSKTRLSALRLSDGSPLAARFLLQPKIWSQREKLSGLLTMVLKTENWLDLLEVLDQENAIHSLHWLGSLLLDAMKVQLGSTLVNNIDVYPLLKTLANRLSSNVMQTILHDI